MQFTKMHGLGNDFVMVTHEDLPVAGDLGTLAREVCDRHFGIGADGLIISYPSDTADIRMRIINADGSEAEMCGNGIRCFARFVYEKGLVSTPRMEVETLAGLMIPVLTLENGEITGITVDMNEPHLEGPVIPVASEKERIIGEKIVVDGEILEVTCVSMGNPHCVLFVEDAGAAPVSVLGPILENHPFFPRRTNVEFVQVVDKHEVIMRVWERGAAETLACGTGACATLVACNLNGLTCRKATVHLAGGDLFIRWDEQDNHVYMTGPAENVFTGDYIIRS